MFCPQELSPSITNLSEGPCVFAAGINSPQCLFFLSLAKNSLFRGSFGNVGLASVPDGLNALSMFIHSQLWTVLADVP